MYRLLDSLVQFLLPASGDIDLGAVLLQSFGEHQPDAGATLVNMVSFAGEEECLQVFTSSDHGNKPRDVIEVGAVICRACHVAEKKCVGGQKKERAARLEMLGQCKCRGFWCSTSCLMRVGAGVMVGSPASLLSSDRRCRRTSYSETA